MPEQNLPADIFLTADERRVLIAALAVDAQTSVLHILQMHGEQLAAKVQKIISQMNFISVTNYQVASVATQGGKVTLSGIQRLYLKKLLDEIYVESLATEIRSIFPRAAEGLQMKLNDSTEDGFFFFSPSSSSGRGENPS